MNDKKLNLFFGITLAVLLLVSTLNSNIYAQNEKNPNVNSIKIEYSVKVAKDTYFVKFKTCIGNKIATNPTFEIKSDLSSKVVKFQKMHQANTCKSYDTTINAKHPSSIEIKMTNTSGFA